MSMRKNRFCLILLQAVCSATLISAQETRSSSPKAAQDLYSVSHFGASNQKASKETVYIADAVDNENDLAQQYKEFTNQFNAKATSQAAPPATEAAPPREPSMLAEGPVINFNNVSITEFLRFVSRLTGKNFIFDPQELQFPVTIISETPASLEDIMAALLQNLRIHGFYMIEEGNSFVVHRNETVKAPGGLLKRNADGSLSPEIATQVYPLKNVTAQKVATVITPMASPDAIVQVVDETMSLVVTDILANVLKISDIVKQLDAPNSNLEVGQYVALNNSPATLLAVAQRILSPIAGDKPLVLVPYTASNSIFIVSSPFLVEKTLSILQSLDLSQSTSGTLNIDQMKFNSEEAKKLLELQKMQEAQQKEIPVPLTQDEVEMFTDREKNAILQGKGFDAGQISKLTPQQVVRILREKGLSPAEREQILGQRKGLFESDLPLGQVESTQFLIHKLQYRKCQDITKALQAISLSLTGSQGVSARTQQQPSDLSVTLLSVQSIEENNSVVFTGTRPTLQKVKELINQLDTPVRQVMIEALVLDTTLQQGLTFGVEWAGKIQRKNFAGQTGLTTLNSSITGPLSNVGFPPTVPTSPPTVLTPINLNEGFSASGIGRKVKYNGQGFIAFGALVNVLEADHDTRILLNPKIVTEHNVAAEIFVGSQIPIKGQSIVNATSSTISNTVSTNYESQNVGTTLRVTPLISASDMVTLIIEEEISNANQVQVNSQGQNNAPPATINKIRATTRVHMPSNYFLMMSGILSTSEEDVISKVPILGSIPIIGFFFSNKLLTVQKRNVVMFIRPRIIDTPIDIEDITQSEERMWKENNDSSKGMRNQMNILKELLNF